MAKQKRTGEVHSMSDSANQRSLTRRGFIVASGAGALSFAAACSSKHSTASGAGTKNALGLTLQSGAASATDQYYVQAFDSTGASYKALDFYESVYSRAPLADQFNIPLVRLDPNYSIVPGAATKWEQAADGNSWTFHIRPGIMWSDGKELTAADYIETLRYSADPKHAWDFSWFWSGVIKNYTEAVAGKVPTSEIGVKQGTDKYALVIQTEGPIAYVPSACLYTTPLSAAVLSKYGSGSYNINPATCVTCGPYTLTKFDPTATIVLGPNKKYSGPFAPPIAALVGKIYAGGDMLPRFQTGEIDTISVTPLDLKIAAKNTRTKNLHLYKNPNDFEIWYTFFDTKKAPFNNVKVRQALAHCVDRDSLVKSLLAPLATPAYGYLTPGYPFAVEDPLKPLTNYDPGKAKSLLAAAGYPNGKGFPQVTFNWWANAVSNTESVVQALTQNWNKQLGINIKLQELDKTTFYARMNKKPTQLGQRAIRQPARQGGRREQGRPTAGDLHRGTDPDDRPGAGRVRLPPALRVLLRPIHKGQRAGQEQGRLRRHPVAGLRRDEQLAAAALRRKQRKQLATPEAIRRTVRNCCGDCVSRQTLPDAPAGHARGDHADLRADARRAGRPFRPDPATAARAGIG